MCGIVGIIKVPGYIKETYHSPAFANLLYADAVRGWDSTGIFVVGHKNIPLIYKRALSAADFLQQKQVAKLITSTDGLKFMVGHNRWMTRGEVTDYNAHPFSSGPITLVHNGTVNNWRSLFAGRREEIDEGVEVDSHGIACAFNHIGVEETLRKIDGGFSLVWYNSEEDSLNFVRNGEKPMFFAPVEDDKQTIVFGSEAKLLDWICTREGMKITKILGLPPGEWNKFSIKENKIAWSASTVELHVPKTYGGYHGGVYTTGGGTITQTSPPKKHDDTGQDVGARTQYPKRIVKFMRRKELAIGRAVSFYPTEFRRYIGVNGQELDYGVLVGLAEHLPNEVHVHGIKGVNWNQWIDETLPVRSNLSALTFAEKDEEKDYILICSKEGFEQAIYDTVKKYTTITRLDKDGEWTSVKIHDTRAGTENGGTSPAGVGFQRGGTRGPGGVYITLDHFRSLAKDGCKCCNSPILDPVAIGRWDGQRPVCRECDKNDKASIATPLTLAPKSSTQEIDDEKDRVLGIGIH